jgi:lipoate-protein ligase A
MMTQPGGTELPAEWRTVRSAPGSGTHNMAVDSALMAAAPDRGFGVWRTYGWSHPTVSFGRHEAVRNRFTAESLAAGGLEAVRRPTGGRALLHDAEVTYSVTMPIGDATPWKAVYAAINCILLSALRSMGVDAELVPDSATSPMRPDGPLCFEQPSPGEIVVRGAKLSGSAVWRERGAYLQHGSILLHDGQHRLQAAMIPSASIAAIPQAASLASCLPSLPTADGVASALEDALRRTVLERHTAGGSVTRDDGALPDEGLIGRHEERFRDAAWLWRR